MWKYMKTTICRCTSIFSILFFFFYILGFESFAWRGAERTIFLLVRMSCIFRVSWSFIEAEWVQTLSHLFLSLIFWDMSFLCPFACFFISGSTFHQVLLIQNTEINTIDADVWSRSQKNNCNYHIKPLS